MRVRVTETCKVVRECQVTDLPAGEVIKGEFAAYLLSSGAPVEEVHPESEQIDAPDESGFNPDGKIEDILAWVDGDHDRARRALDAEQAKPTVRPRLVGKLTELLG